MINLTKSNCRACLKFPEENEKWNSLFAKLDGETFSNIEQFNICTGIEVDPLYRYATEICSSCEKKLLQCFGFILLCRKSNKIIRQLSLNKHSSEFKRQHSNIIFIERLNTDVLSEEDSTHLQEDNSKEDSVNKVFEVDYKEEMNKNLLTQNQGITQQDNIISEDSEQNTLKYFTNPYKNSKDSSEMRILKQNIKAKKQIERKKVENIRCNIELISNGKRKLNNNYICDVCGNSYKKQKQFEFHKHLHTGIKNFKCEVCDRHFAHKSYLSAHMLIHNGERKYYQCRYCVKKFSRQCTRKLHEKQHTLDYSYECTVCNKKFGLRNHLIRHMRIHNDERPYNCQICRKSFRRDHHLLQHFKAKSHCEKEKKNNADCRNTSRSSSRVIDCAAISNSLKFKESNI